MCLMLQKQTQLFRIFVRFANLQYGGEAKGRKHGVNN